MAAVARENQAPGPLGQPATPPAQLHKPLPLGRPRPAHQPVLDATHRGNKAETTTLIPVPTAFGERHQITDLVVVADAGMLSAANLNALEDAGFSFIVGSRITKAPYDLADHFARHGNYFTDGPGPGIRPGHGHRQGVPTPAGGLPVEVHARDTAIDAMIDRAEKITAGRAPLKKARLLEVTGATKELDQATIDRARQLAGLKGYVTNLPTTAMNGAAVIAAYHDTTCGTSSSRFG